MMIRFIYLIYCYFTYSLAIRSSFKCAVYPVPTLNYVITVNLGFNCNQYNISKGCLESVTVGYSPATTKSYILSPYSATLPRMAIDTAFLFNNIDIVHLTLKDKVARNREQIFWKKYLPKKQYIGVPVLGKIFHKFPITGTRLIHDDDIFIDSIKVKSLTSYLILSYEILDYKIQNIRIKAGDYFLLYCRKTEGKTTIKSLTDDEKARGDLFEEVNKSVMKFNTLPMNTKQNAIVFNKYFIKKNRGVKEEGLLGVLSSINTDFTLLLVFDRLIGITNVNDRIKRKLFVRKYSSKLATKYELKKYEKNGDTARGKR
eukprot:GAHX01000864.1.p1 GENE.GAHX01000864.1~~GAHX01000864.1.p1  ORF type:complete len:315 (+),score=31.14 GAHX01000864.1:362-1306(+)